jgi:aminomethyltransferase
MSDTLKQTAFSASFPGGVIEWIDVYGYAVPLTWGNPGDEYAAVRNQAAAMDFSMLLKWDVEGAEAIQAVNSIFSRDISGMKPGTIAYGVVVSETGTMVDDCTVFMHSPQHVRMFGANPTVGDYLDNYRPSNVTISQRREELAQLSVQGPLSREILQKLTNADISNEALRFYHFLTDVDMADLKVQISRIGYTGELGYEIMLPVDSTQAFWDALFKAGESLGLKAAGAACVMMCRIESGLIMGEVDYDHTMTPYDCRMGWSVDLNKDNFQGKEALIEAQKNPSLDVVTVLLPGEGEFDDVRLASGSADIGHVTMAIPSPHLNGQFLGLARIDKTYSAVGTELNLATGGRAKIMAMPVYDPQRIRARS